MKYLKKSVSEVKDKINLFIAGFLLLCCKRLFDCYVRKFFLSEYSNSAESNYCVSTRKLQNKMRSTLLFNTLFFVVSLFSIYKFLNINVTANGCLNAIASYILLTFSLGSSSWNSWKKNTLAERIERTLLGCATYANALILLVTLFYPLKSP